MFGYFNTPGSGRITPVYAAPCLSTANAHIARFLCLCCPLCGDRILYKHANFASSHILETLYAILLVGCVPCAGYSTPSCVIQRITAVYMVHLLMLCWRNILTQTFSPNCLMVCTFVILYHQATSFIPQALAAKLPIFLILYVCFR